MSINSQLWTNKLVADDGATKPIHQYTFPVSADHLNELGWWDLNELRGSKWWQKNALHQRRQYEETIRHVYLQIAQRISTAKS